MKKCVVCGKELPPKKSKYCSKVCQQKRNNQYAMDKRKADGDPTVGVGTGGSNKKFTDNPQYKSGEGNFHRLRKQMREEIKSCERCGKDLTDATRYEWCVHHKDHIRTHNTRDNLIMLCKRCHQVEHDCHLAFNN